MPGCYGCVLTLRDNGPRKRDKCVRHHLPAAHTFACILPKGVQKGKVLSLIFPSSDTLEHGLEEMDTLVGMVTDLDLVQYVAHSGRLSKSGSGRTHGTSSSPSGSSPQLSSPQSGTSSVADSCEKPGSDCSEELSSDGSASH